MRSRIDHSQLGLITTSRHTVLRVELQFKYNSTSMDVRGWPTDDKKKGTASKQGLRKDSKTKQFTPFDGVK